MCIALRYQSCANSAENCDAAKKQYKKSDIVTVSQKQRAKR